MSTADSIDLGTYLAGATAQYESGVVYHKNRECPELVQQYVGKRVSRSKCPSRPIPLSTQRTRAGSRALIIVKPAARVTYTTIQNWSDNVVNLVTKRARVEADRELSRGFPSSSAAGFSVTG